MEEYTLFIHGTASGVASIAVWEGMRYFLVGPGLLCMGMVLSVGVIHQLRRIHIKHTRVIAQAKLPLP